MKYKTISIQEPLFEAVEKYVEGKFDQMGGHPEFDSVPKFCSYVLNKAIMGDRIE